MEITCNSNIEIFRQEISDKNEHFKQKRLKYNGIKIFGQNKLDMSQKYGLVRKLSYKFIQGEFFEQTTFFQ